MEHETTATCPTCGRTFTFPSNRRGRKQVYCSLPCREVASLISRLETLVDDIADKREATDAERKAASQLRGAMFRIANTLNQIGRPVKLGGPTHMTRSGWRGLRRTA